MLRVAGRSRVLLRRGMLRGQRNLHYDKPGVLYRWIGRTQHILRHCRNLYDRVCVLQSKPRHVPLVTLRRTQRL